jgi:mono/diheme cytochrome c family protein
MSRDSMKKPKFFTALDPDQSREADIPPYWILVLNCKFGRQMGEKPRWERPRLQRKGGWAEVDRLPDPVTSLASSRISARSKRSVMTPMLAARHSADMPGPRPGMARSVCVSFIPCSGLQALDWYAAGVLRGLIQIKATAGAHRLNKLMIKRTAIRLGVAAGLPLLLAPAIGSAADLAAGESLADKWCAQCHAVRGNRSSSNPAAPTFSELAVEPSITEYSLRALLRSSHETMPQITFTPDQMDDIVGYILSLKSRN